MKDIRFRAWDNKQKEFHTWEDLKCNSISVAYLFNNTDLKLLQYTGLKDKNDIEIYKDYLLEDDKGRLFQAVEDNRIGKTGYVMSCIKRKSEIDHIKLGGCYDFWSWIYPENNLQVVGNVYENKELLENEKS